MKTKSSLVYTNHVKVLVMSKQEFVFKKKISSVVVYKTGYWEEVTEGIDQDLLLQGLQLNHYLPISNLKTQGLSDTF